MSNNQPVNGVKVLEVDQTKSLIVPDGRMIAHCVEPVEEVHLAVDAKRQKTTCQSSA